MLVYGFIGHGQVGDGHGVDAMMLTNAAHATHAGIPYIDAG